MNNEQKTQSVETETVSRPWWRQRRSWLIAAGCIVAGVILFLSYLRTDGGMRHVVLPVLSRYTGWRITAEHVQSTGLRGFQADKLRIQVPLDTRGAIMDLLVPEAVLDWSGDGPIQINCSNARVRVPTWPVLDGRQSSPLSLESLQRLPDFQAKMSNLQVALPRSGPPDYRVPQLMVPDIQFSNRGGVLLIESDSTVELRGALLWDLIGAQKVSLAMSFADRPGEPVAKGNVRIFGRYPEAASRELEEITVDAEFEFSETGSGVCRLHVRHKEGDMIRVEAVLSGVPGNWQLDVKALGHAQTLHVKGRSTRLQIRQWRSDFSISWLASQRALTSEGKFTIPGISVVLASDAASPLPPITMHGGWTASRRRGQFSWNAEALVSKADDVLLKISAIHGGDQEGSRPVNIMVPNVELAAVRPYLEPFGIQLPDGRVAARFGIDPGGRDEHLLTLDLTVSELAGLQGLPPSYRVTTTAGMSAVLTPGKSASIEDFTLTVRLQDEQYNLLGKASFDLESPTSLPLTSQAWARPAAEAVLKMTLNVSPAAVDHFRRHPPPRRRDPQVMKFNGRLRLDLNGDELLSRIDLQGSHGGIRFLRATANGSWLLGRGLKHLELPVCDVNGGHGLMEELLPNVPAGFERLAANVLIRGTDRNKTPNYQFSAKLKALGLRGWPDAPDWLQASVTTQITGAVSPAAQQFNLSDFRLNAKLFESRRIEPAGDVSFHLPQELQWNWSQGVAGVSGARATAAVSCTQRLIRRLRGDPDYAAAGADLLHVNLELQSSRPQEDLLQGSCEAELALGSTRLGDLAMKGQVRGDLAAGRLEVVNLKSSLPEVLRPLLPPEVPSWETVSLTGGLSYHREEAEANRFSFKLAADDLAEVQAAPDWLRCSGTIVAAGRWGLNRTLRIEQLDWNAEIFELGDRRRACQTKGRLPLPMTIAWPKTMSWRSFLQSIPAPETLKGTVAGTVRAPAAFLAKMRGHSSESNKNLELAMTADLQRATQTNTAVWTTTATYGEKELVQMAGRVHAKGNFELSSLNLRHLRLHYDRELFSILLPDRVLPAWDVLALTASLTPGEERLRARANLEFAGLTQVTWLPDWLTTSGTVAVAGAYEPRSNVLEARKFEIVTDSRHGENPETAHLTWKLTEPVSFDIKALPELHVATSSVFDVTGEIPYAYVHRYLQPEDFTAQPGLFEVNAQLQLARRRQAVTAVLDLGAKLDQEKVSAGTGRVVMTPDWTLQEGSFEFGIEYHEKLRSLFGSQFMPVWQTADLKLTVKPDEQLQSYAFDGVMRAEKLDTFPTLPDWLRAQSHVEFGGSASLATGTLKLQTLRLTAEAGDSLRPDQAILRVGLKAPLVCSLQKGFRPVPGSNAVMHMELETDDRFVARLRRLDGLSQKAPKALRMAADLDLRPMPETMQMKLAVRMTEGGEELFYVQGKTEFDEDWQLNSAVLEEFILHYRDTTAHLIPEYRGPAFGSVKGTARMENADDGRRLKSKLEVVDSRLPAGMPDHWRMDWQVAGEALFRPEQVLQIDRLKLDGTARFADETSVRAGMRAELKAPILWSLNRRDKEQPAFVSRMRVDAQIRDANDLLAEPLTSALVPLEWISELTMNASQGKLSLGLQTTAVQGEDRVFAATGTAVLEPQMKLSRASLKITECKPQEHVLKALGLNSPLPTWGTAVATADLKGIPDGFQTLWSAEVAGLENVPWQPDWLSMDLRMSARTDLLLDGQRSMTDLDGTVIARDDVREAVMFELAFKQEPDQAMPLPVRGQGIEWVDLVLSTRATLHPAFWQRLPRAKPVADTLPRIVMKGPIRLGSDRRCTADLSIQQADQVLGRLTPDLQFRRDNDLERMALDADFKHWPKALTALFLDPAAVPVFESLAARFVATAPKADSANNTSWAVSGRVVANGMSGGRWHLRKGNMVINGNGDLQVTDPVDWRFDGPTTVEWNGQPALNGGMTVQHSARGWLVAGKSWRQQLVPFFAALPEAVLPAGRRCTVGELLGDWSWQGGRDSWQADWDLKLVDASFVDRQGNHVAALMNWVTKGNCRVTDRTPVELVLRLAGTEPENQLTAVLHWGNTGSLSLVPKKVEITGGDVDFSQWYSVFAPPPQPFRVRPIGLAGRQALQLLPESQPPPPVRIARPRWLPSGLELSALDLAWKVEVDRFTCTSLELRDIVVKLITDDDEIQIDDCRADVGDGEFDLKGSCTAKPDDIDLRLTLKVSDLELSQFRGVVSSTDTAPAGLLDGYFTLQMAGTEPRAAWYQGRGKGRLTLDDLRLPPIRQLKTPSLLLQVPELETLAFPSVGLELELDRKHLIVHRFEAVHPKLQITGNGAFRLDGWVDWQNTVLRFEPSHWHELDPRQVRIALGTSESRVDDKDMRVVALPFQWRGFYPNPSLHTADRRAFRRFAASTLGRLVLGVLEPSDG